MAREKHRHLTDEVTSPATWREIAVTVTGVAFLVGVVNLALVIAPTTNTGYLALEQKWHMLQGLNEPVDLLVLGDSSCRQGLDPQIAAERLGLESGLNLCTTGNALVLNDAWMLESYLARFRPPEVVLVIHSFDILRRDVSFPTVAQIPLEWGFWRRFNPRLRPEGGGLFKLFAARYLPLYANNRTLGSFLMRPFHTVRRYRGFLHRMDERGFVSADRAYPGGVRSDMRRHVRFMSENAFRVTEANRNGLERILALADRHGFPVYLIHAPVYEGLARSQEFQRYVEAMSAYLRRQAARSENVEYIPDLFTFPADLMQNSDHVTHPAARRYSMVVASRIAADFPPRSSETIARGGTGRFGGSCAS